MPVSLLQDKPLRGTTPPGIQRVEKLQDVDPYARPVQGQRGPTAIINVQKYMTPIQQCCPSGELLAAMLMLTAKYITTVMLGTTDPEKTTEQLTSECTELTDRDMTYMSPI